MVPSEGQSRVRLSNTPLNTCSTPSRLALYSLRSTWLTSAGERLSVVVVEDYGILREELVHFLALNHFDVAGVNCSLGLDDWLASQPRPPDMVVLDLNLPGESGLDVARRLRATYPTLGIVMLTGRKEPADRLSGYMSGADVYLTKPASGDELLAVVAAAGTS